MDISSRAVYTVNQVGFFCFFVFVFFFGGGAPGTKDCDKEALNLSFSSSPRHLQLKDDYGKHHGKIETNIFKVARPSIIICTM